LLKILSVPELSVSAESIRSMNIDTLCDLAGLTSLSEIDNVKNNI